MNTVRLGAAIHVNGELDAANCQYTRRTLAPLTSPLFSSTKGLCGTEVQNLVDRPNPD
jgi:hypothetical protein